ncbi:hypothetical protein T10_13652 [Trichinella papuae]|uniref:Uncharacterized protein n=1 Tax=Trichinella papuae TaxID=268474 RepID=A0A0V1MD02_9BILA|nr:hypothetical protein T10_13652 [Trichinella papuae]
MKECSACLFDNRKNDNYEKLALQSIKSVKRKENACACNGDDVYGHDRLKNVDLISGRNLSFEEVQSLKLSMLNLFVMSKFLHIL